MQRQAVEVPCLTPQDLSSPNMKAVHGRGVCIFPGLAPRAFLSLQSSAIEDRGPTITTWLPRAWSVLKMVVVKKGAHLPGPGSPVPVQPVESSCGRREHSLYTWLPRACPVLQRPAVQEKGTAFPALVCQAMYGPAEAGHKRRGCSIPSLAPQ